MKQGSRLRDYMVSVDGINYELHRVGSDSSSQVFNLHLENHQTGDYYLVLMKLDSRWVYDDWEGDKIDRALFEQITKEIDEAFESGFIPLIKLKS